MLWTGVSDTDPCRRRARLRPCCIDFTVVLAILALCASCDLCLGVKISGRSGNAHGSGTEYQPEPDGSHSVASSLGSGRFEPELDEDGEVGSLALTRDGLDQVRRSRARLVIPLTKCRLGNRLFQIATALSFAREIRAAEQRVFLPWLDDRWFTPSTTPQLAKLAPLVPDDETKEGLLRLDLGEHVCNIADKLPIAVDRKLSSQKWASAIKRGSPPDCRKEPGCGSTLQRVANTTGKEMAAVHDWAAVYTATIRATSRRYPTCRATTLEGFWQHQELFIKHIDWIRQLFWHGATAGIAKTVLEDMLPRDSVPVGIHLRLTDYIKAGRVLDMSYYKQALEAVRKNRSGELTCVVFSDNVTLALKLGREHFASACRDKLIPVMPNAGVGAAPPSKTNPSWRVDDKISFYMMSQLPNIIIADSTYSFWAARVAPGSPLVVIPGRGLRGRYPFLKTPTWIEITTAEGANVARTNSSQFADWSDDDYEDKLGMDAHGYSEWSA